MKTNIFTLLLIPILISILGCSKKESNEPPVITDPIHGTFVDLRDHHTYKTIKIGKQVWLAENLAYKTSSPSWAYSDSSSYESIYGRLYTYTSAREAVPAGWHLPTDSEINDLITYCGGASIAGKALKESGSAHWTDNGGGDNLSGFTALPSGYYTGSGFTDLNDRFFCWVYSSIWINSHSALELISGDSQAITAFFDNPYGLAVRCIQGPPCNNMGYIGIENKTDTTLQVTITEVQHHFSIIKDYIQVISLPANKPYTIHYQNTQIYGDTIVYLNPCDNILIVVKKP